MDQQPNSLNTELLRSLLVMECTDSTPTASTPVATRTSPALEQSGVDPIKRVVQCLIDHGEISAAEFDRKYPELFAYTLNPGAMLHGLSEMALDALEQVQS